MKWLKRRRPTAVSDSGVRGSLEDTEFRNLSDRLRLTDRLAPGSGYGYAVTQALVSVCVPGSSLARQVLRPLRGSAEARCVLDDWVAGRINGDAAVQQLFGVDDFDAFADQVGERTGVQTGAASSHLLDLLRVAKCPSRDDLVAWIPEDAKLMALVVDLALRTATHSNLHSDGVESAPFLVEYRRAALAGFAAIWNCRPPLSRRVAWPAARQSPGLELVGLALVTRHSAERPVDALPRCREKLDALCSRLDSELTARFGPPRGGFDPVPYWRSLASAAEGGAMLAAIAIDPSACRARFDVAAALSMQP